MLIGVQNGITQTLPTFALLMIAAFSNRWSATLAKISYVTNMKLCSYLIVSRW